MVDGMVDQEKVIDGLQESAAYFRSSFDAMYGTVACEKFRSWVDAIEHALALLKEQEPRVMTLEEVKVLPDESDVWLEEFCSIVVATTISHQPTIYKVLKRFNPDATYFYGIEHADYNSGEYMDADYGTEWRCWTSRPTDKQREATPWN